MNAITFKLESYRIYLRAPKKSAYKKVPPCSQERYFGTYSRFWGLFSVAGILTEFRHVRDFSARPSQGHHIMSSYLILIRYFISLVVSGRLVMSRCCVSPHGHLDDIHISHNAHAKDNIILPNTPIECGGVQCCRGLNVVCQVCWEWPFPDIGQTESLPIVIIEIQSCVSL
jgi:hypothetical protein